MSFAAQLFTVRSRAVSRLGFSREVTRIVHPDDVLEKGGRKFMCASCNLTTAGLRVVNSGRIVRHVPACVSKVLSPEAVITMLQRVLAEVMVVTGHESRKQSEAHKEKLDAILAEIEEVDFDLSEEEEDEDSDGEEEDEEDNSEQDSDDSELDPDFEDYGNSDDE